MYELTPNSNIKLNMRQRSVAIYGTILEALVIGCLGYFSARIKLT